MTQDNKKAAKKKDNLHQIGQDEIEKLSTGENKEPGIDSEDPSTENEEGESSAGFEFEDED